LNMQKMVTIWGGKPSKSVSTNMLKGKETKIASKEDSGSSGGSILGGLLGGLGSVGGGLMSVGGSIISGIAGLLGSVGGGIFSIVGGALSAMGPIGLLLAAGAGYLIYQLSKSINFESLGKGITDSFKGLGAGASNIAGKADNLFGTTIFREMVDYVKDAFDKFNIYAESFFDQGKLYFEEMLNEVAAMAAGVAAAMLVMKAGGMMGGIGGTSGGGGAGGGGKSKMTQFRNAKGRYAKKTVGAVAGQIAKGAGRAVWSVLGPIGVAISAGLITYDVIQYLMDFDDDELKELLTNGDITEEQYEAVKDSKDTIKAINESQKSINGNNAYIEQLEAITNKTPVQQRTLDTAKLNKTTAEGTLAAAEKRYAEIQKTLGTNPNESNKNLVSGGRHKTIDDRRDAKLAAVDRNAASRVYSTNTNDSLLELIKKGESGGNYNIVNNGKAGASKIIDDLTSMTVNEVLRQQSQGNFFAAGAYQVIPKTLAGLLANKVISGNDIFNKETQDKIGTYLAQRRIAGAGDDPIAQQLALAKEWAALPVPAGMALKNGNISTGSESFYSGIAGNKASISSASMQAALGGRMDQLSPKTKEEEETKVASYYDQMVALLGALVETTSGTTAAVGAAASATQKSNTKIESPYNDELYPLLLQMHASDLASG